MAKKTLKYTFVIECEDSGPELNTNRVEELIDLNMQDLVYDDEFIQALDEKQSVTIQVIPGG